MRSQTSREVPEWSGGKDLYMGSLVLVTGKVSGVIDFKKIPTHTQDHGDGIATRGESVRPRTLVDRKRKRYDNAVDVVV